MIKSGALEEIQGCVKGKKWAIAQILGQIPFCRDTERRECSQEISLHVLLLEIKLSVFNF